MPGTEDTAVKKKKAQFQTNERNRLRQLNGPNYLRTVLVNLQNLNRQSDEPTRLRA